MPTPTPRRRVFETPNVAQTGVQVSAANVGAPSQEVTRQALGASGDLAAFAQQKLKDADDLQIINMSNQIDQLKIDVENEALETKGRNAFESTEIANDKFNTGVAEIEKNAFGRRQKLAISEMKLKGQTQVLATTEAHTSRQIELVKKQEFAAASKNKIEASLLHWNNNKRTAQEAIDFLDLTIDRADALGLGDEARETFIGERMSAYHKVIFDKMIREKDTERAKDYLDFYGTEMEQINPSTLDQMQASFKESKFRGDILSVSDNIIATKETWPERFKEVNKIKDPEMRLSVERRLKTEFNLAQSLEADAMQDAILEATNNIEQKILSSGKGTTAREVVEEGVWANMTLSQKRSLEAYAAWLDPANKKNPAVLRRMKQAQTKTFNAIHRLWLYDKAEFMRQTQGPKRNIKGELIGGKFNLEMLRPVLGDVWYKEFKKNQEQYVKTEGGREKKSAQDIIKDMTDDSLKRFDFIYNLDTVSESSESFAFTFGLGESDEEEDVAAFKTLQQGRRALKVALDEAIQGIPEKDRNDKKKIKAAIDSVWLETDVDTDEFFPSSTGKATTAGLPRFLAREALKADIIDSDEVVFTDDVRRALSKKFNIPASAKYNAEMGGFLVFGDELPIFINKTQGSVKIDPRTGKPITAVLVSPTGRVVQSFIEDPETIGETPLGAGLGAGIARAGIIQIESE